MSLDLWIPSIREDCCNAADIAHSFDSLLNGVEGLKIDFVLEWSFGQVCCQCIAYLQVDLCVPQQQRSGGLVF